MFIVDKMAWDDKLGCPAVRESEPRKPTIPKRSNTWSHDVSCEIWDVRCGMWEFYKCFSNLISHIPEHASELIVCEVSRWMRKLRKLCGSK